MGSRHLEIMSIVMCIVILMTVLVSARRKRSETYKVLTFNTTLVDLTDLQDPDITHSRTARRDVLIKELAKSKADLVCLQEVWYGPDVKAIVKGLTTSYRHSYSTVHKRGILPQSQDTIHEPSCASDLSTIARCLTVNNCTNKRSVPEYSVCLATFCGEAFVQDVVSGGQKCLSCVNLNVPDLATTVSRCANISGNANIFDINPSGLMLLSKTPLKGARFVDYYGDTIMTFERGYLQAKVNNKLKVICTHLSSSDFPFMEPFIADKFSSYTETNLFESNSLIRNFQNDNVVLLGDFNTGINFTSGLDSVVPDAYTILSAAFNTQHLQICTFCNATSGLNSFRKFGTENSVIDHVFGGKSVTVLRPKRVLADTFRFMGTPINLSDHFGLMTNVVVSSSSGRRHRQTGHY